jgi:putative SOS response-associated peptidase YedK
MCGRYTLTADQEALQAALGIEILLGTHPRPRFNIAPTQEAPAIVAAGGGTKDAVVRALRWGLVPSWARDPAIGSRMINARSETVAEKPAFRAAFRSGRCLVPADGFYEWTPDPEAGGAKRPWWIHRSGRAPFTFAGLRERWGGGGSGADALETFTLLTAPAMGPVERLHHRMPVVVPEAYRAAWLHEAGEGDALAELLAEVLAVGAEVAGGWRYHPVSRRVNRPSEDDAGLIEAFSGDANEGGQGSLFGS